MSQIKIRELIDFFQMTVLAGENGLDNIISEYGLNRAGLELAGYFEKREPSKARRAIFMSGKEHSFIMQFDSATRREKYINLIKSGPPLILITSRFSDKELINVAKELDFPLAIFNNEQHGSELIQHILDFYDNFFAPTIEIHASLTNIFGKGVLIQGKSGIGKSEIALELIKNNHLFVGDDRIVVTHRNGKLFGKSHPILKNLVEVRGIGIIDLSNMFGHQVIMEETLIDLVIELIPFKEGGVDETDRLGNDWTTVNILGNNVPHLKIPVSAGRNLANIIEIAVGQLKLQLSGDIVDVIELMSKRWKQERKHE